MELLLTPQEPGTSNNIVKDAEAGLKRGLQLCTQTEVYVHTSDIMYIYTVIGKRGSRIPREGPGQSNPIP